MVKLFLFPPQLVNNLANRLQIDVDRLYTKGGEIDLLVGMSVPQLHKQIALHEDSNGLAIMETRFGPCIVGRSPFCPKGSEFNVHFVGMCKEIDLWNFVEAEAAGVSKECPCLIKTDEEIRYEKVMNNSWARDETGYFEVKLPWKIDPTTLQNNRCQALQRDESLNKQLSKNAEVKKLFSEQIEEMTTNGILKRVNNDYPSRYLPLLAVVDLHRESTKVRVCLDAKAKFKNMSFNDALLKGKLVMPDMLEILTLFRTGELAMIGDIQKMFWQIRVHSADQKYQGVIWKNETYVFTRVCFGNKPSPPIAEESMIKIAQHGKESYPEASNTLMMKRYMDDIMESGNDEDKLLKKRDEIDELLGQFGFKIKLWYSNCRNVGEIVKIKAVLGCNWDMERDTLSVNIRENKMDFISKRTVLSTIAEIWDPIGITSGVMILARLVFQSIVRLKLDWDEPIQDLILLQKWKQFLEEIAKCKDIVISRNILPPVKTNEKGEMMKLKCSLIGFCDGSDVANGCVTYLKWYNEDESFIEVKFLAAKGKVAPIRGITTPRNELCGTLMLARLSTCMLNAMKKTELEISENDIKLFCDNTTVLAWLGADPTRFKPFVKNKVVEVQELISYKVWRYIPSSKNTAADLISKGCNHGDLKTIIEGPITLRVPEKEWPKSPVGLNDGDGAFTVELKSKEYVMAVANVNQPEVIDITRYSSWKKLLRITTYVLRFVKVMKKKKEELIDQNKVYSPDVDEMKSSEEFWIKYAQKNLHVNEKRLQKLSPYLDENGILRVYGRLQMSKIFNYDRMHPIILPCESKIAELIIDSIHKELFHPGHLRVVAESRKKYWVLCCRKLAKRICYKCVTCRRWRKEACEQIMSNLPDSRLAIRGSPFQHTCIDYFGQYW